MCGYFSNSGTIYTGMFQSDRYSFSLSLHPTPGSTGHVTPHFVSSNHSAPPRRVVQWGRSGVVTWLCPRIGLSVYIIWLHFLKITLPLPQPTRWSGENHVIGLDQSEKTTHVTWYGCLQYSVTLVTARGLVCYLFQLPGSQEREEIKPISRQSRYKEKTGESGQQPIASLLPHVVPKTKAKFGRQPTNKN